MDVRMTKIAALLEAGDWAGLQLPSPREAVAILMAGDVLEANGHRAQFDEDDGITWCTNPYGVDGVLCGRPDPRVMTRFLVDMAKGVEYGLVPY